MPDKATEKLEQVRVIAEQAKVLTPDAIDRIIDQNVEGPVEIAEEGISLFQKIGSVFRRKKKKGK